MNDRPMHTVSGAFQRLQQLYAEGEAALERGNLDGAVHKFTEGLAIDDHFRQRYVTMYAQRAFALQKLGRLDEAIADYTRAIALGEPPANQAQYYFHRAMCFAGLPSEGDERRANVELAVADHGRSIELYPDHPGPHHLRAKLLVNELERYADALPDLDRALAMRELPDLYSLRGFALFNLGRIPDAMRDFDALKAMSNDPYGDYMLACCHAKLGNAPAVFHHVGASVARDPAYAAYYDGDDDFAPYRADARWTDAVRGHR